jgi:hypothetical protein
MRTILGERSHRHLSRELYDESQITPRGRAIYSLAAPRDLRMSRYSMADPKDAIHVDCPNRRAEHSECSVRSVPETFVK